MSYKLKVVGEYQSQIGRKYNNLGIVTSENRQFPYNFKMWYEKKDLPM